MSVSMALMKALAKKRDAEGGALRVPLPGSFEKVHLRGEAPWAECIRVNDDDTWLGRIDNECCSPFHAYRYGQEVIFRKEVHGVSALWVPADAPQPSQPDTK